MSTSLQESTRTSKQLEGESIDPFYSRLQKLAKKCGFQDKNKEIKAQITVGCSSRELQKKLLGKPTLTLDEALTKSRALETVAVQLEQLGKSTEQLALAVQHNKPKGARPKHQHKERGETNQRPKQPEKRSCSFCGGQFHDTLL